MVGDLCILFFLFTYYITVTEFAKKTGDYPSLSATDIKVLALTYQLETENVGTDHLKKEPEKKVLMFNSDFNSHAFTFVLV